MKRDHSHAFNLPGYQDPKPTGISRFTPKPVELAPFVTYGPYTGLNNAQNIGLLENGVMVLIGNGQIQSIMPLSVEYGGIGIANVLPNDLLVGDINNAIMVLPGGQPLQVLQISSTGQVIWGDVAVPVGLIPVTHGGTGLNSSAMGTLLYGTGTTVMQRLLIGTVTQLLTVSGGVPIWTSFTAGVLQSNGTLVTSSTIDLTDDTQVSVPPSGVFQSDGVAITCAMIAVGLISGILPIANGGSGTGSIVSGLVRSNGTALSGAAVVDLSAEVTSILPLTNGGSGANVIVSGLVTSDGITLSGGGLVDLAAEVTGILAYGNGGTGVSGIPTGSGVVVLNNTPSLASPLLGTPTSGNLSNCTNYPASALSGVLGVAGGGTGVAASTGTVAVVLSNTPTLVTPNLGTAASGNLLNCTGYTYLNMSGTPIWANLTASGSNPPVTQTITMNTVVINISNTQINGLTSSAGVTIVPAPSAGFANIVDTWVCVRRSATAHATGTVNVGLYYGTSVASGATISANIMTSAALKATSTTYLGMGACPTTGAITPASTITGAAITLLLASGSTQYTSGSGTTLTITVNYSTIYVLDS